MIVSILLYTATDSTRPIKEKYWTSCWGRGEGKLLFVLYKTNTTNLSKLKQKYTNYQCSNNSSAFCFSDSSDRSVQDTNRVQKIGTKCIVARCRQHLECRRSLNRNCYILHWIYKRKGVGWSQRPSKFQELMQQCSAETSNRTRFHMHR